MELKFRFGKSYKNGEYVGKVMCSSGESFEKWLQDMKCDCYEISEEEYESLS